MATPGYADIQQVRILVSDTEPVFGANSDEYLFTDDQIAAIYGGVGKNSILRTAGFLCNSVGNSEALILKVIQTQDLTTDGSKLQATWSALGARYIGMADAEDTLVDESQNYFRVIDYQEGWYGQGAELIEWPHI